MVYCGLDVAMMSSYLHVSDAGGNRLMSGPVPTESQALRQRLGRFVPDGLKVAIEAGNQTAWLHETLTRMGADVTVVNPTKVKLIAESRRKTDKIDAKISASFCGWTVCPGRSTCFAEGHASFGAFWRPGAGWSARARSSATWCEGS